MFSFFTEHRFMPCAACGASVERTLRHLHVCDPDRRHQYDLFRLREEIAAFDAQLAAFLDSPAGRFEAWLAARSRRRRA
jgi:hypothetical protein